VYEPRMLNKGRARLLEPHMYSDRPKSSDNVEIERMQIKITVKLTETILRLVR
jgi:hypothetical protein